jgi:hypothetical protein
MLSCLEAMFAYLQFRLNQLSIVIRHCLVKRYCIVFFLKPVCHKYCCRL